MKAGKTKRPGLAPMRPPSQAEGLRGRLEVHWRAVANAINRGIAADDAPAVAAAIRAAKVAEFYARQHGHA